jgi:hypothetical protein
LGKLGSRWFFYRLPDTEDFEIDLIKDHGASVQTCAEAVSKFIQSIWKGYASVNWNREGEDRRYTDLLAFYAKQIAKWRGIIVRQDNEGYNPPMIEVPFRLAQTLYALTRGHAIIHGRNQIDETDVNFVTSISYGNVPEERARLYKAFMIAGNEKVEQAGGYDNEDWVDIYSNVGLGLRETARALGCSEAKAQRVLEELIALGVIQETDGKYRRMV